MSKRKKKDKKKTSKTYYISGMHCASCELLVEKKILKQTNAKFADASLGSNSVTIQGGKSLPSALELTEMFSGDGYGFSDTPQPIKSSNTAARYWWAAILIVALFYLLTRSDGGALAKFTAVDSSSSLAAFFILGLVASVSSCAALVGGLLLSLTKQWHDAAIGESATYALRPHIGFHAGRLGLFVIGGGALGLVGSSLSLNNLTVYAILISAVSIIMLVLGLQMLGVPFAQRMRIALPKTVTATFANADGMSRAPYLIGAGTFFLPCGFTLIAQGIALTAGSFLSGAAVMGAFALGTLPVLAGISYSGLAFTKKPHLTARFQFVAGVLVVVFALYNVNGQLNVLGLPSISDFGVSGVEAQDQRANMSVADPVALNANQQILQVVAHDFAYTPVSSTTLKAGLPTTLIVDNQGVQGCGAFMAARGLWDGWIDLKLGENRKTFVPKKGTYKLTCSMGMVPPVTISVI